MTARQADAETNGAGIRGVALPAPDAERERVAVIAAETDARRFPNRADAAIRASFGRAGARTEVVGLFETGGYRLRLPRSRGADCEAVVVNTGGGIAGGDRVALAFSVGEGASATLTTTAAEKVYRSGEGADARLEVELALADGAALAWLPQETILFEGARLRRSLAVEMPATAELLMAEVLVFGRLASGETLRAAHIHDRWRIRRGGRLAMAEDLLLSGNIAGCLDRPALGNGSRACATVLMAAPRAEGLLERARDALASDDVAGGASAWNGLLVARALSPSPVRLRAAIVRLLSALRGRALPRLWS